MSFMNKMRGWGRKRDASADEDDSAFESGYAQPGAVAFAAAGAGLGSSAGEAALAEAKRTSKFDSMPPPQPEAADNSIITHSLPSETADFSESRQLDDEVTGGGALPMIGHRPIADQQRILVGLVGLGLIGLIVLIIVATCAAPRPAARR